MKVVILGAGGQLGRQLGRCLAGDIVALSRTQADLTKTIELRRTLHSIQPRLIINAAAYTQVDRAEAEPSEAFAVNALALRELAAICRELEAKLVHISTDYVF